MITDSTYKQEEAALAQLFSEAGWQDGPLFDEQRVKRIEQRAMHELIAKESTNFVFMSFGSVIANFTSTFLGGGSFDSNQDYRL